MAFCKNKLTNIFDFSKLAAYRNVHDCKIEGATIRDVHGLLNLNCAAQRSSDLVGHGMSMKDI
jgi:hypothetical protein